MIFVRVCIYTVGGVTGSMKIIEVSTFHIQHLTGVDVTVPATDVTGLPAQVPPHCSQQGTRHESKLLLSCMTCGRSCREYPGRGGEL